MVWYSRPSRARAASAPEGEGALAAHWALSLDQRQSIFFICCTYLSEPTVRPLMMYRERKQNTTMMGTTEMAMARYMAP